MKWPWLKQSAKQKRIYLDYAAATPLSREAKAAIEPYLTTEFGNPSAIHQEGVKARQAVEAARASLARLLKIRDSGIVFTGSGTESNNLALYGIIKSRLQAGAQYPDLEIITTAIEHPSITEVVAELEERGVVVHRVRVAETGLIDLKELEQLLSPRTALVTFAYANSEIGVVQDVKRITRLVKKYNSEKQTSIRVHLDAAQAPYWLPCQFDVLGVDVMILDAGKCGGPKGVGVLAFKNGIEIAKIQLGGGQEHGLRAGTENVTGIVGAVEAFKVAQADWESRSAAVAALRDYAIAELLKIPGVVLNGPTTDRIANNVNISISGIDTEYATIVLDAAGVAVSTKSACSGAGGGGSSVILAISNNPARAASTLRLTFGPDTTKHDLDYTISVLKKHLREMSNFSAGQNIYPVLTSE